MGIRVNKCKCNMKKFIISMIIVGLLFSLLIIMIYKPKKNITINDLYKNLISKNNDYGYYIYDEYDRYVTLVNYNGDEEDIVIPDYIHGKPVVSIEDSAFYGNTYIKTIKISKNVIKVGHQSFIGCSNLEIIFIPSSVIEFGSSALDNTFSLKKIVLDKNSKVENVLIDNGFKDIIEYK